MIDSQILDSEYRNQRLRVPGLRIIPALLSLFLTFMALNARSQTIGVTVNGQPVVFQGLGPQQVSGRVLVPVRGVLEKIGADVSWTPQTRTVVASNRTINIQLRIGDNHALVNGRDVILDVPAQVISDSTFVPLRFLGEALGAEVNWDGRNQTVVIVTRDRSGPPPDRDHEPRHRPDGPAPVINSFTQDAKGWLRAGDRIHVHMEGTPGGQAAFRIPGLAEEVPMREISPGNYVGEWQVPTNRQLQLAQAAVIGELKVGDRMAQLLQAAQPVEVDAIPPQVIDRAPTPDTHINNSRPNIYAVYADQGSGIDPGSIHLLLNGHDVTGQATVSPEFISYTPASDLPSGPQVIQLSISDRAGNRAESDWKFIEDRREQAMIRAVTDNANRVMEPGDTLHVAMIGTPGGKADFSLGNIRGVPLPERQPGQYSADYTIHKGDDVAGARLVVRLTTRDGTQFERQSDNTITIKTGRPSAPVITYPGPRDVPSGSLVVKGIALPNSRIRVKIAYSSKVLGVVSVNGTAIDGTVQADGAGRWQAAPINLNGLLGAHGIDFTISATAISISGEQSDTTSLHFQTR